MNDPRLLPGFDPSLFPLCDGALFPLCDGGAASSPRDGNGGATVEFLAAYYELNRRYQTLLQVRARCLGEAAERAALQAIEQALIVRDALEDQYAPFGIVATPQVENGFTRNITFVQAPRPKAGSSLSMRFGVARSQRS